MDNENLALWRKRANYVAKIDMVFLTLKWVCSAYTLLVVPNSLNYPQSSKQSFIQGLIYLTGAIAWQFVYAVLLLQSTNPTLEVKAASAKAWLYKINSIAHAILWGLAAVAIFRVDDFIVLALFCGADSAIRIGFLILVHKFITQLKLVIDTPDPIPPAAEGDDECQV